MKTLSIIIPCYNEQATLRDIVAHVQGIATQSLALEIIIVDDCSKDASYTIATALGQEYNNITVLQHHVNQGKGAALRTGFMHATGDYVGVQDADLEYNPAEFHTLLEPLVRGDADVVYGSRYLKPDTRRVLYFWHTWMNKTLTFLSNCFTNLDITDMETCYKVFKREVIQDIAPHLKEKRFGFEPEITARVAQGRYRVYECAISYAPRTFDEGKKIGWRDGVRALYCILHYSAHTAPLPMQLMLYFFIGLVCAVINIHLFSALYAMGSSLFVATAVAFVVAAICNYLLCIWVLFRHKAYWSTRGEIGAYALVLCVMYVVDYATTASLIAMGISAYWSKVIAVIIGFIGNFLLRKHLVFREKRL